MIWSLAYAIPLSAFVGIYFGSRSQELFYFTYLSALYAFVIHPILDRWVGPVALERLERVYESPWLFRLNEWLLLLSLPTQGLLLFYGLSILRSHPLSLAQIAGIILSVGISTGAFGITAAHELVHRRWRLERGLGVVLLSLSLYAHFRVEHVWGHHRWVATPEDPSTARRGESFYSFLGRAIRTGWTKSWEMEVMKPWWRNRLVHYVGFQVALLATVAWSFGAWGALAFVLQSAVGIFLLEGVNYIEHYGLVRKEISKGVYEPFSDQHSWDCDSLMTNGTLFSLGMHAHHHGGRGGGLAMVPFEKLRPKASAPKLPWGYSLAILIACVPPLWISRMETHLPKNSSDSWQGSRAS